MAEVPCNDFIRLHPAAHLVISSVVPPRTARHAKHLQRLLNQLIREPTGNLATAVVRVDDMDELHCGFETKADADRLASLVEARGPRRSDRLASGWSSQRSFALNLAKEVALAGLLATPDKSLPVS